LFLLFINYIFYIFLWDDGLRVVRLYIFILLLMWLWLKHFSENFFINVSIQLSINL